MTLDSVIVCHTICHLSIFLRKLTCVEKHEEDIAAKLDKCEAAKELQNNVFHVVKPRHGTRDVQFFTHGK